jgi:hypothetical protein
LQGRYSKRSPSTLLPQKRATQFMSRPQKNILYRRTKRVELRLTDAEEKALIGLAEDAGLSVSDFIRKAALGSKPRVYMATPERASFIKGLAELGKIGSNVNQIAKALNTDLATRQRASVSGELISATLYGIQSLSKNLLKHLTNGHQG